jgi:lipoprotein
MRTTHLALLAAGIALSGIALSWPGDESPAPRGHAATPERPAVRPPDVAPVLAPSGRFVVGDRRAYRAVASYQVELAREQGPATPLALGLDATWELTVLRVDQDEVVVAGELTGAVVSLPDGAEARPQAAAVAGELARRHLLVLDPQGRLTEVRVAVDQSQIARRLVYALASSTQLVGVEAGRPAWETEESDPTGSYAARYRRTGAGGVEKTKARYLRLASDGDGKVDALSGRTVARLDQASALEALKADETLSLSTGELAITTRSRVELELLSSTEVAVGDIDLGAYEPVDLRDADAAAPSAAADRALVAGASLADLLAELAAAGDDDDRAAALFDRLTALLRLEPAAAAELAARLRAGADARTIGYSVGALAGSGTIESRHALVELLGAGELDAAARAQVAVATTTVEQPDGSLITALAQHLDAADLELRNTSSLALGAVAARLAASDGGQAAAIVDDLLSRLAATDDPEQQVLLLRALGNAGDARALPAIRAALGSASGRIRRAAVEALRRIAEPTVDALIAQVLLTDPDPGVRRGAIFALGARPLGPEAVALLDRAASTDASADVRDAARRLLDDRAA